jgi:hypothetical protein
MRERAAPGLRRWVNRSVAREVDRDRARWLWGLFVAMLLGVAPFAAYLLEKNECLRLSYEASALRQVNDRLIEQQRRLRMQRSDLESLPEIETWAVQRHGLVRPSPQQLVVVRRAPPEPGEFRALGNTSN